MMSRKFQRIADGSTSYMKIFFFVFLLMTFGQALADIQGVVAFFKNPQAALQWIKVGEFLVTVVVVASGFMGLKLLAKQRSESTVRYMMNAKSTSRFLTAGGDGDKGKK